MRASNGLFCLVLVFVLTCWLEARGTMPPLNDLPGGLCVHVGMTDGAVASALTDDPRSTVHALTKDAEKIAAVREMLRAQGKLERVAIEKAESLSKLPYSSQLADVAIADLDALAKDGPAVEELQRIVRPGGVVLVQRSGKWERLTKPGVGKDDWREFNRDASQNPVSQTVLGGPADRLQWLGGYTEGNGMATHNVTPGVRVAGGRYLTIRGEISQRTQQGAPTGGMKYLECRSAFNGLVQWTVPMPLPEQPMRAYYLVCDDERVYTVMGNEQRPVALSLESGKVVQTYKEALPLKTTGRPKSSEGTLATMLMTRVGDLLIQIYGRHVVALDVKSGAKRWQFDAGEGKFVVLYSHGDAGMALLVAMPEGADGGAGRKGFVTQFRSLAAQVDAVVMLDPATGKEKWRTAGTRMPELGRVSDMVQAEGVVALMQESAASPTFDGAPGKVVVLDAATGVERWRAEHRWTASMPSMVIKNKAVYVLYGDRMVSWEIADGKQRDKGDVRFMGVHGACKRARATADMFILNDMYFVTPDNNVLRRHGSRGGCSVGGFPAYGMMFYGPNYCECYNMLHGNVAFAVGGEALPIDNGRRLTTGPGKVDTKWAAGAGDWPTFRADNWRSSGTGRAAMSSFESSWKVTVTGWRGTARDVDGQMQDQVPMPLTAPVAAGGSVVLVDNLRCEVVALDGKTGAERWRYAINGVADTPPTLANGVAYVGSHDGAVYAINLASGELVWRYVVAPAERRVMMHGRVASPWPVRGSVLVQNGTVLCIAGTHQDVDGGLTIRQLDAATGKELWTTKLDKVFDGRNVRADRNPNFALNDVLVGTGETAYLGYFVIDPQKKVAESVINTEKGSKTPPDPRNNVRRVVSTMYPMAVITPRRSGGWVVAGEGGFYTGVGLDNNIAWRGEQYVMTQDRAVTVRENKVTKNVHQMANPRHYGAALVAGDGWFLVGVNNELDAKDATVRLFVQGELRQTITLPAPLTHHGLAIAGDRLYATLGDGSVQAWELR